MRVEPAHNSGDQRLRATKKRRYAGWSTGYRIRIRVPTIAVFLKEAAKLYTLFCGLWKDASRSAVPVTIQTREIPNLDHFLGGGREA
jgi:hypothetical protein